MSKRRKFSAEFKQGTVEQTRQRLAGLAAPESRGQRGQPGVPPPGVRNWLERDLFALEPETKWITDITEIKTDEGKLYLRIVLDLFNQRIVGWSMQYRQDRQMVSRADGSWQLQESHSVIMRSDRGNQFGSGNYQHYLMTNELVCSMSAAGHCGDNAACEKLFGLLKFERIHCTTYPSRDAARADVFKYIERSHNPRMRRRQA